MDINAVTTLISTMGFPIVMCLAMGWYVKYITDKNREQLDKQNDSHTEELKQVTDALNNNTLALTKLCERIDKE